MRHVDAVGAIGGAALELVEEDDAIAMLDRVEVHVGDVRDRGLQLRELEVVRRKERVAARHFREVARNGVGEREPVEGRGATADFVDQHQALRGRVVEDRGGLGHFHHERRTSAGEVVGRPDAREDAVDGTEGRGFRGHERSAVGEEGNLRDLAHVGGFPAHVRPGDEEQLARAGEARVVGDEVVDLAFDHEVAALANLDAVVGGEGRAREPQDFGRGGEGAEGIQPGGGRGDFLQACEVRVQILEERVVERLLARECPLARGQRLVLERLEFRGDEALRVLHRLAALVLDGDLVELALGHLDEEAVHAVEFHAQVGDASAIALPLFHGEQERAAIVLDHAQLVQLRVAAVADHSALANDRRGLVLEGARKLAVDCLEGAQLPGLLLEARLAAVGDRSVQRREAGERVAQPREIARARGAQRHPRGDALDIGPGREEFRQPREAQAR